MSHGYSGASAASRPRTRRGPSEAAAARVDGSARREPARAPCGAPEYTGPLEWWRGAWGGGGGGGSGSEGVSGSVGGVGRGRGDERPARGQAILEAGDALGQLAAEMVTVVRRYSTTEQWTEWLKTPLYCAARKGKLDLVNDLVECGADVNGVVRRLSASALHMAARKDHPAVLQELVRAGADTEATATNGMTALHVAAVWGCEAAVKTLLRAGAAVDAQTIDEQEKTALLYACQHGYSGMVNALLDNGANVHVQIAGGACKGDAPLHSAAAGGHVEVVRQLLDAGAIVDARGGLGRTELHMAACCGHTAVVRQLASAGANAGAMDEDRYSYDTPLHLVAYFGHVAAVQCLWAWGRR